MQTAKEHRKHYRSEGWRYKSGYDFCPKCAPIMVWDTKREIKKVEQDFRHSRFNLRQRKVIILMQRKFKKRLKSISYKDGFARLLVDFSKARPFFQIVFYIAVQGAVIFIDFYMRDGSILRFDAGETKPGYKEVKQSDILAA